MKLGQLIKCEIKNDFVKESYTKCCGVTGPFLKNQNWAYLWINSLKFYLVCIYYMPSWVLSKYAET